MITISMTSMAAARKVVRKTEEWLTARSVRRFEGVVGAAVA
jgi:hypothetical protein